MTYRVVAHLGGGLADPDAPLLRADDLGVLRGDGVFETVLVVDGVAVEFEAHLARLARSAAMLGLPAPDLVAWRCCAQDVMSAWGGGREMMLRLVLTRGVEAGGVDSASAGGVDSASVEAGGVEAGAAGRAGTGFALGSPVPPSLLAQRRDGVAVVTLTRGTVTELVGQAPWLLLGAKTLSYATNMAAVRHAERLGAQDVVFTAADGAVLEGPTSTVVIAQGASLLTPPAERLGLLTGTTQAALFRAARETGWQTREELLRVPDLLAADGVWLCSSVRLLTRVHTLDDHLLPDTGLTPHLLGLLPVGATRDTPALLPLPGAGRRG